MLQAKTLLTTAHTCLELFSAPAYQRGVQGLDLPIHDLLRNPKDTAVDFHGQSGSGKTHLLYLLVIEALIRGKSVIVFDTDLKWDSVRLLHLLNCRLAGQRSSTDPADVGLAGNAGNNNEYLLDSVYIYQPQSSAAFYEASQSILELVQDLLPEKSVRYIMVDSMTAFYWQSIADPMPSEQLRAASKAGKPNKRDWITETHLSLLRSASLCGAQLVYTTWDLSWHNFTLTRCTRLQVQKKQVLQFTQGLEHAMSTKEARAEVLERGIFHVRREGFEKVSFYIKPDGCGCVQAYQLP